MIDLSALLKGEDRDSIRYSKDCKGVKTGVKRNVGPVVAWNITKRCNFLCSHCYSSSNAEESIKDLSTEEVFKIIDILSEMNVPVLLLSGGEPMIRKDIFDIIAYCKEKKIRVSLSTNGSLIGPSQAQRLKELGVGYVGISLDGMKTLNDKFRGIEGAFEMALKGIESCNKVGQKVGLRMTIHKENIDQVADILELMEKNNVHRICFYHLVPSGRGEEIDDMILSEDQMRDFMDYLIDYTEKSINSGEKKEILTVTNHCDGPYIYMNISKKNKELSDSIYEKLSRNGGNRSGIGIMNMDWEGNIYPDQFSKFMKLGNILEDDIRDIWYEGSEELKMLRNKKEHLNQTCKGCKWLDLCGGNLRGRAYHHTNNLWGMDPSCYLKEWEI
jgi:radical SAM protein with 4Fe4S-binding SPASM domain